MAGVSVGTVSRYLNGAEIKESNRSSVEAAVKALEYQINPFARTLKTNKTYTVGVVIPRLSDIYATTIVDSVEEELYRNNYTILVCDSGGNSTMELERIGNLMNRMVDGLILYPTREDAAYLEKITKNRIPCVTVDMRVKGYSCDQVVTDNIHATFHAAEWLIKANHRKIGVITGDRTFFTAGQRLKGYEDALQSFGIPLKPEYILAEGFSEKSGYDGIVQLMSLPDPPTAVISCNYYTTIGAMKAVYELGIRVPDQLSIIGFDNIGVSEIARPALSIVVQPMQEVGKTAAQLLLKRLQGDYGGFPSFNQLKTNLLIKDSTKILTDA